MSEELVDGESREAEEPLAVEPSSVLRTIVSLVFSGLFVFLVVNQETWLLDSLVDPDTHQGLPNLYWRLVWPVGCLGVALLFPLRGRLIFLGVVGLILTGLTIADDAYFRFFGSVPSLASAGSIDQLWDVSDSVLQLMGVGQFGWLLQFGVFFLAAYLVTRVPQLESSEGSGTQQRIEIWRTRGLGSALLVVSAYTLYLQAWQTPIFEKTHHLKTTYWVMPADHWGSRYSRATYAATFGVFNYHLSDIVTHLRGEEQTPPLPPEHVKIVHHVASMKKDLNDLETPLQGIAAGRRVVILQLEAIQHWVLDLSIDGVEVMPTLNRLAKSGLSWDYVMDVTATGRTADAEFAVMTGLLPDSRPRPKGLGTPSRSPNYLGHILQGLGYRTASYHGYKRSFWDRAYNHPIYGMQEMHFEEAYPDAETLGLGVPDPVVFDYVIDRIAAEPDSKSLSMIISLSSHHPFIYTPKEYDSYFERLRPENGWGLSGAYLRSARYTDDALAEFLAKMEARGLLEDTLFVIYGDHDMGFAGKNWVLPEVGPRVFMRVEDRVPFVITVPGEEQVIAAHREAHTDATGGLHDTLPTILHLLGAETPAGVMGTNLLVPDRLRGPVPLPTRADGRVFAFRQNLMWENSGRAEPIDEGTPVVESGPNFEQAFIDQTVSHALKDEPDLVDSMAPRMRAATGKADGRMDLARQSR